MRNATAHNAAEIDLKESNRHVTLIDDEMERNRSNSSWRIVAWWTKDLIE
jgi:hypothetical protein